MSEDLQTIELDAAEKADSIEVAEYPPLTVSEDTFALAMVEYGGNIKAAYRAAFGDDAHMPNARGRELLNKPAVALRIRALTESVHDAAMVSMGAHLHELAEIRDLAKVTGQLKVALSAEQTRGRVVGLYKDVEGGGKGGNTQVNVVFASKYDGDI